MSSIVVVVSRGVVAMVAMIGLADAFVHLACWGARNLKEPTA
ncbi:MAG: hypothetical protein QM608_04475 [Caulobacter sp.]